MRTQNWWSDWLSAEVDSATPEALKQHHLDVLMRRIHLPLTDYSNQWNSQWKIILMKDHCDKRLPRWKATMMKDLEPPKHHHHHLCAHFKQLLKHVWLAASPHQHMASAWSHNSATKNSLTNICAAKWCTNKDRNAGPTSNVFDSLADVQTKGGTAAPVKEDAEVVPQVDGLQRLHLPVSLHLVLQNHLRELKPQFLHRHTCQPADPRTELLQGQVLGEVVDDLQWRAVLLEVEGDGLAFQARWHVLTTHLQPSAIHT